MPPASQHMSFGMANQNSIAFASQHLQMPPPMPSMMSMQMGSQYSHPQAIQSVMRHPSPVPNQGYVGMSPPNNTF
jgi:hypothetical protein